MKRLKRIFWILAILLSVILLFRGVIYRGVVKYKTVGARQTYAIDEDLLNEYIKEYKPEGSDIDIKEIIDVALNATSNQLYFSKSDNYSNPNKLIRSERAHCVGYAAFYTTVCNQLLGSYGFFYEWEAIHAVGQLYVCNMNIHNYINHPFLMDHDFVIIKNRQTGEKYAVDPSLYDYLRIRYVSCID